MLYFLPLNVLDTNGARLSIAKYNAVKYMNATIFASLPFISLIITIITCSTKLSHSHKDTRSLSIRMNLPSTSTLMVSRWSQYMKCLIPIVDQKVQDSYINANTNTRTNIIYSRTTTPQTTLASKNRGMATAPRANILSICLTVGCKRWHIYV